MILGHNSPLDALASHIVSVFLCDNLCGCLGTRIEAPLFDLALLAYVIIVRPSCIVRKPA